VKKPTNKMSFFIALGLHGLLAILLLVSLEKTVFIPAEPSPNPHKEIISATVVNQSAIKQEVARLAAKEKAKERAKEAKLKAQREQEQALALKERELKQKHEEEEALLMELKQTKEALKKEAQVQKLAAAKEQKEQKEALKKLKQEKETLAAKKKEETELKAKAKAKQKEKEKELEEALALETKQRAQEKESKEAQEQQASGERVKQDLINRHAMLMRNKIHQYWRQPIGLDFTGFSCKIEVRLLPTGEVVDAAVIESSGSVEFDRSTELAIRKASPLPMPQEPDVAKEFHQFTFTFHPEAA
jgi:colicin import membrane protein